MHDLWVLIRGILYGLLGLTVILFVPELVFNRDAGTAVNLIVGMACGIVGELISIAQEG